MDGVLYIISGRGWSQVFGTIFEDNDLGRDPEHDILWSEVEEQGWGCSCVMRYQEETRKDGNGESGHVEGVGYQVRRNEYHLRF